MEGYLVNASLQAKKTDVELFIMLHCQLHMFNLLHYSEVQINYSTYAIIVYSHYKTYGQFLQQKETIM